MFKKDGLLVHSSLEFSPHNIIPKLISAGSLVLDVGCNTGFLGKYLLESKKCITDGVDINDQALKKAKNFCRSVYKRDLYIPKLGIKNKKYDYIIFADILEHLPRPDLLLKDSRKYLKKNGQVIICIPNVARLNLRLKLLLGNFDYRPGIMSEDHLRFFTKRSAQEMIVNSGYKVKKIIPTGFSYYFYKYFGFNLFSSGTAFSFIFVCEPN